MRQRQQVYCASPDPKGREITTVFEGFLRDNPKLASPPYGAGTAAMLSRAFPCPVGTAFGTLLSGVLATAIYRALETRAERQGFSPGPASKVNRE